MSQPSAPPRLLSPEAVRLIDGQYADRPHLRPILDAVLAALLPFGAVTVEARQTLVSLVTPRRTFAVVQATPRTRVDLGLRLADPALGGRPTSSPRPCARAPGWSPESASPARRRARTPPGGPSARNEPVRLSRTQPDRSDMN